MRTAYTFAILEVSPSTYDEISLKLRAAGYNHVRVKESGDPKAPVLIDMDGIALQREEPQEQPREAIPSTKISTVACEHPIEPGESLGTPCVECNSFQPPRWVKSCEIAIRVKPPSAVDEIEDDPRSRLMSDPRHAHNQPRKSDGVTCVAWMLAWAQAHLP